MKFFLKLGVSSLLTLSCFYLFVTSYVAENTENNIREWVLNNKNNSDGLLHLDIVNYKRSFFKSDISLAIHSDDSEVESVIGGSILKATIKHGPLILGDQGLYVANAVATAKFDMEQLNANADIIVENLFDGKNPLKANIFVDFNSISQYDIRISPIMYELFGTSITADEGVMKGYYYPLSSYHVVTYDLGNIAVSNEEEKLITGGNQLSFVVSNNYVDSRVAKGVIHKSPLSDMSIAKVYRPAMKGISKTLNRYIPDYSHNYMQQIEEGQPDHPEGEILTGIVNVLKQYAELKNLDQQVGWRLADVGSTQDGQDHIHELLRKLEKKSIVANNFVKRRFLDSGNVEPEFPLEMKPLF